MKVIVIKHFNKAPKNFNGICRARNNCVFHFKNGKLHNEDGPATIYVSGDKDWFYKKILYGINNQFTIKTWKKKVKHLKRQEKLSIFI